jgi:hypothetical protein
MQKSFLVRQAVDFGQTSKFLIRPGDILVFDSQNQNKVTVYRNGEIQKVLPNQSSAGLTGLMKSGWITEIHANDVPKRSNGGARMPSRTNGKPAGSPSQPGGGQTTSASPQPSGGAKKRIPDSTV